VSEEPLGDPSSAASRLNIVLNLRPINGNKCEFGGDEKSVGNNQKENEDKPKRWVHVSVPHAHQRP
jgi:hypothetical protein